MRAFGLVKYITPILIVFPFVAVSKDISFLQKGYYLPDDVGCSGIGGAGAMYFDGSNISGHYEQCKTHKLDKIGNYKFVCIEAQGVDRPITADIERDPDRSIRVVHLDVRSSTSFVMKRTIYNHCPEPKRN